MSRNHSVVVTMFLSLILIFPLVIQGQSNSISSIEWSPDSNQLAVGTTSGQIMIQDSLGNIFHDLNEHNAQITDLKWNQNGNLASSDADGTVIVWDISTWIPLFNLPHNQRVISLEWNSLGDRLFTAEFGGIDSENYFRIWNASNGTLLDSQSSGIYVNMDWDGVNSRLAVADIAGVNVINGITFELEMTIDATTEAESDIYTVSWHPNGTLLATGSLNGDVSIWDTSNQTLIQTLSGNDTGLFATPLGLIRDLIFVSNGDLLLSISADGSIRGWQTSNWELTISDQLTNLDESGVWSPDGSQIAYGEISGGGVVIEPAPSAGATIDLNESLD